MDKNSNDLRLRVSGLHVSYGGVHALRGVSVDVSAGQVVGVVGANGAGKTTLLRSISGLEAVRDGEIRLGSQRLNAGRPWDIAALGVAHVPQNRRCFAQLTVEENLRMGAYRLPAADVPDLLARVFENYPVLHEKRAQPAGELSGGQQQMVAIGRALMSRPRVLLLDEPALGLSPLLVKELVGIISGIATNFGTGVLLAEQNSALALKVCAEIHVLANGGIVLHGPTDEIREGIAEAYFGARTQE